MLTLLPMQNTPSNLSPRALDLLYTKPRLWEYRLFAQILTDEITQAQMLKSSPAICTRQALALVDTGAWLSRRCTEFITITNELVRVYQGNHEDAFGPPGVSGDPGRIAHFARHLAKLYRQMIEWVHSVRFADMEPACRSVAYEVSFMPEPVLQAIESLGPALMRQYEQAAALPEGTSITIDATLNLQVGNQDRALRAIVGLSQAIAAGQIQPEPGAVGAAGYIYILRNESMPTLLKIGRTARSPRERIAELSSATGVPTPFDLAFDAYVDDCARAEVYVHAVLEEAGHRAAANREFFNVDLNTAIAVVIQAQKAVAGLR